MKLMMDVCRPSSPSVSCVCAWELLILSGDQSMEERQETLTVFMPSVVLFPQTASDLKGRRYQDGILGVVGALQTV